MPRQLLALLVLLGAAHVAMGQSQVYRTIDENGNVVYTDKPAANSSSAQEVAIPPVNSAAPPPDILRPAPPASREPAATSAAVSVSISSPANDEAIPVGPGNFDVVAAVEPALKSGQRLQLLMDGEAQGEPQTSTLWQLINVFNGTHTLTINLLDADNQVIATSEPVIVHVLRNTVRPGNLRVWQAGQDADGNWSLNPGSVRNRTIR